MIYCLLFAIDSAYQYLQDALDEAQTVNVTGVAVAAGTYYPDEDKNGGHAGNSRYESFELVSDTGVYGGLTNSAWVFQDRDPQANVTTLSGDIQTVGTDDTDNAFHVVVGADKTILDGFTITKGYADGSSPYDYGGGMYNEDVSPVVTNCIFNDNSANYGGGMFNDSSSPTIANCLFYDNETIDGSGGDGAAIYCYDQSDATIENCTISENLADRAGGGIVADYYSDPQIKNSIVWGNDDAYGDADIDAYNNSAVTINYSNYGVFFPATGGSGSGTGFIRVDPLFANAEGGDFHLQSEMGRWTGSSWDTETDSATSPCINSGDPVSGSSLEPEDNGDRINMGFYGNTAEASKSDLYPFSYTLQTDDIYALPTEAAWNVSGGSVNMSDLDSGEVVMIPAGTYTVSFDCDNDTPYIVDAEGQSKTVTSSSVNYYTATYQACGALQISAYCPATLGYLSSSWGRWSYDGGSTWNNPYNATSSYVKALAGSYTIEFEDYTLLSTPSDINLTVSNYEVEQWSRTYLLNDVYVDRVSGSDSYIGTASQPVSTIQNALGKVAANGNIWLHDANYYEALNYPTNRAITLRNNAGVSWVRLYNTYSRPGNINYVGVLHEGMGGF